MQEKFELGDMKFAEISTYRGKTTLDFREWYQTKDGELARTRKGVKLSQEEWEDFKSKWEEFSKFVDEGFNK